MKNYKNQNAYLKISTYLNQASNLRFRPSLPLYRNQSTDIWNKWMGWFLYNGTIHSIIHWTEIT